MPIDEARRCDASGFCSFGGNDKHRQIPAAGVQALITVMNRLDVLGIVLRVSLALAFALFGYEKVWGTDWVPIFGTSAWATG